MNSLKSNFMLDILKGNVKLFNGKRIFIIFSFNVYKNLLLFVLEAERFYLFLKLTKLLLKKNKIT